MEMPNVSGLWHFMRGISHVQQWTGAEHKEMQKVFVALLSGAIPAKVLTIAQAVIDFIYYAQFHQHTTTSLHALETALATFHQHKDIFVELGVWEHFNIPKLHSMVHYPDVIRQKGCLDGYNTELSEHLHIDFVKHAYRAGNHQDYTAHMTTWLRQQDAVELQTAYLAWLDARQASTMAKEAISLAHLTTQCPAGHSQPKKDEEVDIDDDNLRFSPASALRQYKIAKGCPFPQTTLITILNDHSTSEFLPAVQTFIQCLCPEIQDGMLPSKLATYQTYKKLKVEHHWNQFVSNSVESDIIRTNRLVLAVARRAAASGHFNVALIVESPAAFRRRAPGSLDGACQH